MNAADSPLTGSLTRAFPVSVAEALADDDSWVPLSACPVADCCVDPIDSDPAAELVPVGDVSEPAVELALLDPASEPESEPELLAPAWPASAIWSALVAG